MPSAVNVKLAHRWSPQNLLQAIARIRVDTKERPQLQIISHISNPAVDPFGLSFITTT